MRRKKEISEPTRGLKSNEQQIWKKTRTTKDANEPYEQDSQRG